MVSTTYQNSPHTDVAREDQFQSGRLPGAEEIESLRARRRAPEAVALTQASVTLAEYNERGELAGQQTIGGPVASRLNQALQGFSNPKVGIVVDTSSPANARGEYPKVVLAVEEGGGGDVRQQRHHYFSKVDGRGLIAFEVKNDGRGNIECELLSKDSSYQGNPLRQFGLTRPGESAVIDERNRIVSVYDRDKVLANVVVQGVELGPQGGKILETLRVRNGASDASIASAFHWQVRQNEGWTEVIALKREPLSDGTYPSYRFDRATGELNAVRRVSEVAPGVISSRMVEMNDDGRPVGDLSVAPLPFKPGDEVVTYDDPKHIDGVPSPVSFEVRSPNASPRYFDAQGQEILPARPSDSSPDLGTRIKESAQNCLNELSELGTQIRESTQKDWNQFVQEVRDRLPVREWQQVEELTKQLLEDPKRFIRSLSNSKLPGLEWIRDVSLATDPRVPVDPQRLLEQFSSAVRTGEPIPGSFRSWNEILADPSIRADIDKVYSQYDIPGARNVLVPPAFAKLLGPEGTPEREQTMYLGPLEAHLLRENQASRVAFLGAMTSASAGVVKDVLIRPLVQQVENYRPREGGHYRSLIRWDLSSEGLFRGVLSAVARFVCVP